MFNPKVEMVMNCLKDMVNHHKEELTQVDVWWEDHKIDAEGNIQPVPRVRLYFKY